MKSDKLDASVQIVAISEIIRDVAATAAPLIAKKHNQLTTELAEDLGAIETDPLKLRQCILNLLSNAAKFTSHGMIKLVVRKAGGRSDERLIIEVSDSGIGMSRESLSRIFQNFSQAELDTTQKFGGTGLGLALTQRFCKLMGGTVSVDSELGEGSTFVIELPYVRGPVRDSADAQDCALAGAA